MKRIASIIPLLVLLFVVAVPVALHAQGKKKGEIVMKIGNKVHLFHSGNVKAQTEIAVGDVLPVFRTSGKMPEPKEVGQVKVTGFISEHYIEGEIVKGEAKVGDIVKSAKSGLLVQPAR